MWDVKGKKESRCRHLDFCDRFLKFCYEYGGSGGGEVGNYANDNYCDNVYQYHSTASSFLHLHLPASLPLTTAMIAVLLIELLMHQASPVLMQLNTHTHTGMGIKGRR